MGFIEKNNLMKWAFRPQEFKNLRTERDRINYSRYIASWYNAGGGNLNVFENYNDFTNWLISLDLTEGEIFNITKMATLGKIELERSAKKFILKG